MAKNVIVAQSGGPTPVINNSLRGVIETCRAYPSEFGHIYGAWHGIEGILQEELLDLSAQDQHEIDLLATTPAAGAIGTCRYKLKSENSPDFQRALAVMQAHNVGWFFYIGGNDSMDTAHKISLAAERADLDLTVVGIPKTIDNDVGDPEFKLLDHTPGYGSAARYWACCIQNANEENAGSYPSDPVLVIQIMGRKMGFITAATRLADPQRTMPLQIYMPEAGLTMEELADNVSDQLRRDKRCIVALSEGFDFGALNVPLDAFGHVEFSAASMTAQLAVVTYLNQKGLPARGTARGHKAGTEQRSSMVYASNVDLAESFQVAAHAVNIARTGGSGWMATILRRPGRKYQAYYDKAPLQLMANSERSFPAHWLAPNKIDVTDDFIHYAQPLLGNDWVRVPLENGLQRFTRFKPVFAPKKLENYIPEVWR